MTIKPAQPIKPQQASRMKLEAVTRGKLQKPPRVMLFGVEGVGKTTFAAGAPAPIFLCAEDGTAQIDVARFPEPRTWQDALDALVELTTEQHAYKTLIIDTVDWLEPLCWDYICKRDGKKDIEEYGFSKGQNVIALNQWRIFVAAMERMCKARDMGVIMLAHSYVKTFKNPEDDDYDRYEMSMHHKAAGLLKQWADATLFARHETFANKDDRTKRVRGISTGARVMHTNRTAAYDAKNRYDLPDVMPLDYATFAEAVAKAQPADPAKLLERIEAMLQQLTDAELEKKVRDKVAAANGNAAQLAQIADKLSARIQIKAQEEGAQ